MVREKAVEMSELIMQLVSLCQRRELMFVSRYGLTISEFRCIYQLSMQDRVAVHRLAEAMKNTPSRMSRLLDTLVKKGVVQRIEPVHDRRVKIISLTPDGKKLARTMIEEYHVMNEEILSKIQNGRYESVVQSLKKLTQSMEMWQQREGKDNQKTKTPGSSSREKTGD